MDRRRERGDVREAAEGLRVGPDQAVVQAVEQLVGVVAAERRQDPLDGGIGERLVQIRDARLDGRGVEPVEDLGVGREGDPQAQPPPSLRGELSLILGDRTQADGRGDHPDLVTGPQLVGYHGVHRLSTRR